LFVLGSAFGKALDLPLLPLHHLNRCVELEIDWVQGLSLPILLVASPFLLPALYKHKLLEVGVGHDTHHDELEIEKSSQ
jgi:hypothetical protein